MASVWTAAAGGAATGGRPRAGWGDDLAAALLGTWLGGLGLSVLVLPPAVPAGAWDAPKA